MIRQVVELLATDGDVQTVHVCEVTLALTARIMNLREHHFPFRTGVHTPLLEPPLQRTQLALLESTRIFPAQMRKHRFCLDRRMLPQDLLNLAPNRFERVRSRPPVMRLPDLARQLFYSPVLPRRLLVHPRFRRRLGHRRLALCQLHQSSHLLIRYHPNIF